ncbi:MAG: HEAT repeat domain-containing protein [Armatimonadota bacterium]|nr:HEAT repeat domain-containing protein [Armatimonadota bacterium]MDR7518275.1 HEAT repeat domain-containing protein [Armatimonadota bacterium]MDR7548699.1 HEAT repeat domain-containing protein [Armatimonadota bacterium]
MAHHLRPAAVDGLIDRITTWHVGMPVRAMEQILAAGDDVVPVLAEALLRWQEDEDRDLLWLVVLLGQSRSPSAVDPLVRQMCRTDLDLLAPAACEALAVIGPPAVPVLCRVAQTGDSLQRACAYAALGWITDDRAYAALAEALSREHDLGDVLALALADQGRPEVIPQLYEAYRVCAPWQRLEFEGAIRDLHWRRRRAFLWEADWRLRYRRLPAWEGGIEPSWIGISLVVRRDDAFRHRRHVLPLRPLEEILAAAPSEAEGSETCEHCHAPIERPTGIPVCPETALEAAVLQVGFLDVAGEAGLEDLFDLLDAVDDHEWEIRSRQPTRRATRRRWQGDLDQVAFVRQTCRWLIEQGIEAVGPAKALLLAKAGSLADRFGDPQGLLQPVGSPARVQKVGRNAPCPCGSGRKYKHCCGKV